MVSSLVFEAGHHVRREWGNFGVPGEKQFAKGLMFAGMLETCHSRIECPRSVVDARTPVMYRKVALTVYDSGVIGIRNS